MHRYLLEMLQCPACRRELRFTIEEAHMERADIRCPGGGTGAPLSGTAASAR